MINKMKFPSDFFILNYYKVPTDSFIITFLLIDNEKHICAMISHLLRIVIDYITRKMRTTDFSIN